MTRIRYCALCLLWVSLLGPGVAQADENMPLPLAGEAYRVAHDAYDAYDAHRYQSSERLAREAIRQRPDVIDLRVLLANALAAQGQRKQAHEVLTQAIADFGPQKALVARRNEIDTFASGGGGGGAGSAGPFGEVQGPAFQLATRAYREYALGEFEASEADARAAIDQMPHPEASQVEPLHDLLIDALSAQHKDLDAYAQIVEAKQQYGDSEALRTRRDYIGARIAQGLSRDAEAARAEGDLGKAVGLAREAAGYAPDRRNVQMQLTGLLLMQGDDIGAQSSATAMLDHDPDDVMAWALRGYAKAASGDAAGADADFAHINEVPDQHARDTRVAHAIVADVWIAEARPQQALDWLAALPDAHDDTDSMIALRRYRARRALQTPQTVAVDPGSRPVFDWHVDDSGATCDVYAADPGFAFARASRVAGERGDHQTAVDQARQAVDAAPDDPMHRMQLIDALVVDGDNNAASQEARQMIAAGQLDGLDNMNAAFIAQRGGDDKLALRYFDAADRAGSLPATSYADAGYAALRLHQNEKGARYLERAIDAGTHPVEGGSPASSQALDDERAAHAEATRNWGFNASISNRNGGSPATYSPSPVPGAANNWQTGAEVWWRPFGSLGGQDFQVYARGYESFGVKGDQPSGVSTLDAAIGARVKPFSSVNAIFAIERIVPIGADTRGDWLARAAWSDGFGTALRHDVPSWWTGTAYAEVGHYLEHPSTYATGNLRFGRTYTVPSVSPDLTVFPHVVLGADYDSTIDRSVPVGVGAGVSARYAFRGGPYDTPRSFVDVSLEYRFKVAGDDRARGVFFTAVYSY